MPKKITPLQYMFIAVAGWIVWNAINRFLAPPVLPDMLFSALNETVPTLGKLAALAIFAQATNLLMQARTEMGVVSKKLDEQPTVEEVKAIVENRPPVQK